MTQHQHLASQHCEIIESKIAQVREDAFATLDDLVTSKTNAALNAARSIGTEIGILFREKRWEDILALFHPVEEKAPEVAESGTDLDIRRKIAFALGQASRFDEAIEQLNHCIARRKDSFYLHNAMAYTAYNSLYAAMNREVFLRGKHRAQRIELAHRHFNEARRLRPDGVTNGYRQGMLYKQIEGKPAKAVPLFIEAIKNWERMDETTREDRRQEFKNYVKALYNGASALLAGHRAQQALDLIQRCMKADAQTDHVAPALRHFALGKVYFHLNRFEDSRQALETALTCRHQGPLDFVRELLARTWLCLNDWEKALAVLRQIPEKRRRPYIRWTEADALCASGDLATAAALLDRSAARDGRSRHKTLIRLSRIFYLQGEFAKTGKCAADACRFFQEQWGKDFEDGLFWQALSALKGGDTEAAREHATQLKACNPEYPKLDHLMEAIA